MGDRLIALGAASVAIAYVVRQLLMQAEARGKMSGVVDATIDANATTRQCGRP